MARKFLLAALACLLLTVALAAGGAWWLLFVYPDTPVAVAAGYKGRDFEVRSAGGTPYLVCNGLPYPTAMDRTQRKTIDLDGVWRIRKDQDDIGEKEKWFALPSYPAADWSPVSVPATPNSYEGRLKGYNGVTWYVRTFEVPAGTNPALYFYRLGFDGVLLRSKVWLNGQLVGSREGGYTPFYFDVTSLLRPGAGNVLTVRVDDRLTYTSLPPRIRKRNTAGWAVYGGIYRSVRIEEIPRQYIFKVAVDPVVRNGASAFKVTVLAHHHGAAAACTLTARLRDPGGVQLGEQTARGASSPADDEVTRADFSFPLDRPQEWNAGTPALYDLEVSLKTPGTKDVVDVVSGFRTVATDGSRILVNGQPVFLRGICVHADDPLYGATQTAATVSRDIRCIEALGANYVRLVHYPQDLKMLFALRDKGLFAEEEIPLYQAGMGFVASLAEKRPLLELPLAHFGNKQLFDPELVQNVQRQLIEMIERDRNNPAVLIWGIGNECWSLGKAAGDYYRQIVGIVRMFDRTRPITMAEQTYAVGALDDLRSAGRFVDIVSVNLYYGWYYGDAGQAAANLDRVHKLFAGKPVLISEFGAGAAPGRTDGDGFCAGERIQRRRTYSEEYQAQLFCTYLGALGQRPWIAGVSPWVLADFQCPWFPHNPVPNFNLKGIMSSDRIPKESFFVLRTFYRNYQNYHEEYAKIPRKETAGTRLSEVLWPLH